MLHGGIRLDARDEKGRTALHLAAATCAETSMKQLLKLNRTHGLVDVVDVSGVSALMTAAQRGAAGCVNLLLHAGANAALVDKAGLTAEAWARQGGHTQLTCLFVARVAAADAEPAADEDTSGDEGAANKGHGEEEQLREKMRSASCHPTPKADPRRGTVGEAGASATEVAAAAAAAAGGAEPPPTEALWAEVATALSSKAKELRIVREGDKTGVDAALFRCIALNSLSLRLTNYRPLTRLPAEIGGLAGLTSLDVSNNALQALPDALGSLSRLRTLNASRNQLSSLPAAFGQLTALRICNLSNNLLSDVAHLASCASLETLILDHNSIQSLAPARLGAATPHLAVRSASYNLLTALPVELCGAPLLKRLGLSGNELSDLPFEIIKLKKLTELEIADNPFADASRGVDVRALLGAVFFATALCASPSPPPSPAPPPLGAQLEYDCATEETTFSFACPAGSLVTSVRFANYGVTTGVCNSIPYVASPSCTSNQIVNVSASCVGLASCSFFSGNTVWGDPCPGTGKRLCAELICTPPSPPPPIPPSPPLPPARDAACSKVTNRWLLNSKGKQQHRHR